MVVAVALVEVVVSGKVPADCSSEKMVSKSPILKGRGVEGARVLIATVGKPRVGLQRFSLAESLLSRTHDLISQRLKGSAWNPQDRRNPRHRRRYRSRGTPSMNSNRSKSGESVLGSLKG